MKTSTFLTKVLKSFNGGKSYSSYGAYGYHIGKTWKNRNLMQAIDRKSLEFTFPKSKAQMAIANSLGHANLTGFQTHGYSKVAAVLKAAIKRERESGN